MLVPASAPRVTAAGCRASTCRVRRGEPQTAGTDYIDLYQLHGPDPDTPLEESLSAADDLIRAGKIRYLGCSNFYGWQIAKTNGVAALKGFEPLVSAQHLYNLIRRDIDREICRPATPKASPRFAGAR